MTRYAYDDLLTFSKAALKAMGVPDHSVEIAHLYPVLAQAMGSPTHGLSQLGALDGNMPDTIEPGATPAFLQDNGASALVHGTKVMGQLCFHLAVDVAISKAKSGGVGVVAVKSSHWVGSLAPYLLPISRNGLLGFVAAQNSQCQDSAPFGGIEPKLSTNPLGITFPVGPGEDDLVIADFSTASMSMAKTGMLAKNGQRAPHKQFINKQGEDSDDPNDMLTGGGSIHLMGGSVDGHKGYALSLWCEAMTALSGGNCNNPDEPQNQTFVVTVYDPDKFAGSEYYLTEMKRLAGHVKTSTPRPGFDSIRLPGESSLAKLRDSKANGVPVNDLIDAKLKELAEKYSLDMPKAIG